MPLLTPGCCQGDQRASGDYIPAFGSPAYVAPMPVIVEPAMDLQITQDVEWWSVKHCIPLWLIILALIVTYYVGKNS